MKWYPATEESTPVKAWAYKMKMEALKHQGKTLGPLGPKWSTTKISTENNESETQVKRYIRLTNLIPQLLRLVDEGKIAFRPAVEISYLTEKQQFDLLETMESAECTPSLAQAIKFKELSRDELISISDLMLSDTLASVRALGAELDVTLEAKQKILDNSYNPRYGARPIRREIQKSIEDPLSEIILAADNISGAKIVADVCDGEIRVSLIKSIA